jgi:hypothetical protein
MNASLKPGMERISDGASIVDKSRRYRARKLLTVALCLRAAVLITTI